MIFEGLAVALAVVLVAAKFKITTLRRALAYHQVLDVLVTVTLIYAMGDTARGIFAALVGGLILSVTLVIARKTIGYEKRVIKKCSLGHMHTEWESATGIFNRRTA